MARRGALHLVLALGAVLVALPFAWELLTSFKTLPETAHVPPVLLPQQWHWDNYSAVFETVPFGHQMVNTVLMTAGRTFGQLLFCSLAAFAFARLEFPFRNALFLGF